MTNLRVIFLCETDNGRKFEVNISHVSQRIRFTAGNAGVTTIPSSHARLYHCIHTHSTALHTP
jgi:hypothetical protein